MNIHILPNEEFAENIFYGEIADGGPYKIIEECAWEDEGKYQLGGVVFEYQTDTYLMGVSRSGSYHTDYHYEFELKCPMVKQVEVTKKIWVAVK